MRPPAADAVGDVPHPADGVAHGALFSADALLFRPRRGLAAAGRMARRRGRGVRAGNGQQAGHGHRAAGGAALRPELHRRLVPRGASAAMGTVPGAGGHVADPGPLDRSRRSSPHPIVGRVRAAGHHAVALRAERDWASSCTISGWRSGRADCAWTTAGRSPERAARSLPGAIVVAILLAATLWALVRKPMWGFLGAWFFLMLAPTSSFMPIRDLAFEHRMYLPLAAVVALAVVAAHLLSERLAARLFASEERAPAGPDSGGDRPDAAADDRAGLPDVRSEPGLPRAPSRSGPRRRRSARKTRGPGATSAMPASTRAVTTRRRRIAPRPSG